MSRFFDPAQFIAVFPRLLGSVHLTVGIALGAFLLGALLGLVLAAVQLYRVPVARQFATVYISFMRTAGNYRYLEAYCAVAVVYWGLTIVVERATFSLEKRVRAHMKGGVAV